MTIVLDGSSLTRADVVEIARKRVGVSLAPAALARRGRDSQRDWTSTPPTR